MPFGLFFFLLQFHQHFGIQPLLFPTRAVFNSTLLLALGMLTFKTKLSYQFFTARTLPRFISLFNLFVIIRVFLQQTFCKVFVYRQQSYLLLKLSHSRFQLFFIQLINFAKFGYGVLPSFRHTFVARSIGFRLCESCGILVLISLKSFTMKTVLPLCQVFYFDCFFIQISRVFLFLIFNALKRLVLITIIKEFRHVGKRRKSNFTRYFLCGFYFLYGFYWFHGFRFRIFLKLDTRHIFGVRNGKIFLGELCIRKSIFAFYLDLVFRLHSLRNELL